MHFTEKGQKPHWGIFDEAMELTSMDFSPHKTTTWKCTDQYGTTGLAHNTWQAATSCLSPQLPHHKASSHQLFVPTTTSPQGKQPPAVCPHNYLTTRQAATSCLYPQLPNHKARSLTTRQAATAATVVP